MMHWVRVFGLPPEATEEDIKACLPNLNVYVMLAMDERRLCAGFAWVRMQLAQVDEVVSALRARGLHVPDN